MTLRFLKFGPRGKKDRRAHYIMLKSMHDDLVEEFENFPTAMAMWEQLKFTFGGTSITRLKSLVLKFETHHKDPKVSMTEHLRGMSSITISKYCEAYPY